MRVILDRQHLGKPSKPNDHGAVNGELRETDLTSAYIEHARDAILEAGGTVYTITDGEYGDRHKRAVAWAKQGSGPCAYVACHINAGGGKYALTEHDARSAGGKSLAWSVVTETAKMAGIVGGKVVALKDGERGLVCIDGIYAGPAGMSGIIYEPGFIDFAGHADLWTPAGLRLVGQALAKGVMAWAS